MRKVLKDVTVHIEGDKVIIVMDIDRLELGMVDAHGLALDLEAAVRLMAAPR